MTIPGGAGSETSQARQETTVRDESEPGLPAATGAPAGSSAGADADAAGGAATESVRDSGGDGQGSAEDPSGG